MLQGIFVRSHLALVDPAASSSPRILDLNPHFDYSVRSISLEERRKSLGDPRGVVWNPSGTRLGDLSSADLRNCIFTNVDLRGTTLENAKLSGANLLGADVDFVDWHGAQASNAVMTAKARLIWRLSNEDFSDATNLVSANLTNASLAFVRLARANLLRANFRGSILVQADLNGADLRFANFTDADLTAADLRGAKLQGATFRNADLTLANSEDAEASATTLNGALFRDTIMPDGSVRNPSPE